MLLTDVYKSVNAIPSMLFTFDENKLNYLTRKHRYRLFTPKQN